MTTLPTLGLSSSGRASCFPLSITVAQENTNPSEEIKCEEVAKTSMLTYRKEEIIEKIISI